MTTVTRGGPVAKVSQPPPVEVLPLSDATARLNRSDGRNRPGTKPAVAPRLGLGARSPARVDHCSRRHDGKQNNPGDDLVRGDGPSEKVHGRTLTSVAGRTECVICPSVPGHFDRHETGTTGLGYFRPFLPGEPLPSLAVWPSAFCSGCWASARRRLRRICSCFHLPPSGAGERAPRRNPPQGLSA